MEYSHEVIRLAQQVQNYFAHNDVINTAECSYLPWSDLNESQKSWWFEMADHILNGEQ